MPNPIFNASGVPGSRAFGSSASIRAEFAAIAAGLDKFPEFTGNAGRQLRLNVGGTAFEFDPNTYLTAAAAADIYQPQSGMAGYLTVASAASSYVAKAGATMTGTLNNSAAEAFRIISGTGYLSAFDDSNTLRTGYISFNAGVSVIYAAENGAFLSWYTAGLERMRITAAGVIQDVAGNELGYKGIPRNTSWGLQGQCTAASTSFTIPSAFAGWAGSIYNDSASPITISQGGGVTLRLAGTTTTGNRTLAARGMANIWWNTATEGIMSGDGLS